jgi:multiple sugar transport system substrate-binding protein
MKTKIKLLVAILMVSITTLSFSGCGCKQSTNKSAQITLQVWGLFDDRDAYADIFDNFVKVDPIVANVEYKKLSPDTYREEVLDALASGQGPDVILIHNTWLPGFKDKLVAAPDTLINLKEFQDNFVDVVVSDFVDGGKIYAAPLSVDSMAMYYNKDLFNEAGITSPPKTWDEFLEDMKKLIRIENGGKIVQAGTAMGTIFNINRSTDLINMLMMQNGTKMMDDAKTQATFDMATITGTETVNTGENALKFYTQFAKTTSPFYTWNNNMHYSIDAFSQSEAATMFNYSWHIPTIESKAPKLNYAVAEVPQINASKPLTYANYWGYGVVKNKISPQDPNNPGKVTVSNDVRTNEAWKLVKFMTMKMDMAALAKAAGAGQSLGKQAVDPNFDPAVDYLKKTNKPAARRDIIEVQKSDPVLGIFAKQNLYAKSWFQYNPIATEAILGEMVDQVNRGVAEPMEALRTASQRITKLLPANQ